MPLFALRASYTVQPSAMLSKPGIATLASQQHLLVEMQPAGSIADHVALHFASFERFVSTAHTKGTRLLGWYIANTTARWFDTSACFLKANTTTYQTGVDLQTGTVRCCSFRALALAAVLWEARQVLASHLVDPGHDNIETIVVAPRDCSADNIEANAQYSPHVLVFDMMVRLRLHGTGMHCAAVDCALLPLGGRFSVAGLQAGKHGPVDPYVERFKRQSDPTLSSGMRGKQSHASAGWLPQAFKLQRADQSMPLQTVIGCSAMPPTLPRCSQQTDCAKCIHSMLATALTGTRRSPRR
eukprot:358421-Chlamydomonas_euryale.AAC.6